MFFFFQEKEGVDSVDYNSNFFWYSDKQIIILKDKNKPGYFLTETINQKNDFSEC